MKKYINKEKLSNRGQKNSTTINTRGGGSYLNMYSKQLQKLTIGKVSLQHVNELIVPCSQINANSDVILSGVLLNSYILSDYILEVIADGETITLDVTANNTWTVSLSAYQLYKKSIKQITLLLTGTDTSGNEVIIDNKINVTLGLFCELSECFEDFDSINFSYDYVAGSDTSFKIIIDNETLTTNSIDELKTFLENHELELEIHNFPTAG